MDTSSALWSPKTILESWSTDEPTRLILLASFLNSFLLVVRLFPVFGAIMGRGSCWEDTVDLLSLGGVISTELVSFVSFNWVRVL